MSDLPGAPSENDSKKFEPMKKGTAQAPESSASGTGSGPPTPHAGPSLEEDVQPKPAQQFETEDDAPEQTDHVDLATTTETTAEAQSQACLDAGEASPAPLLLIEDSESIPPADMAASEETLAESSTSLRYTTTELTAASTETSTAVVIPTFSAAVVATSNASDAAAAVPPSPSELQTPEEAAVPTEAKDAMTMVHEPQSSGSQVASIDKQLPESLQGRRNAGYIRRWARQIWQLIRKIWEIVGMATLFLMTLSLCPRDGGQIFWTWVAALVLTLAAAAMMMSTDEGTRARKILMMSSLFVLLGLLMAWLAVNPFIHYKGRIYVTNTEGHALFDERRYLTETKDLIQGARLVVANGFMHQVTAMILASAGEPGSRFQMPWLSKLGHRLFPGTIVTLNPTFRRQDRAVPMELGMERMEKWTDLSGAPCVSYRFERATDAHSSFTLALEPRGDRGDGMQAMRTKFEVNLTSGAESALRIHLISRQESLQWHDVPVFNDFDLQSASYTAILSEFLNSPNLQTFWAEHQDKLWEHVPSDRERLRLLLIRTELEGSGMNGNIFKVQTLPEVIRMETLLTAAVSTRGALVQDQLLYWCAVRLIQVRKSH